MHASKGDGCCLGVCGTQLQDYFFTSLALNPLHSQSLLPFDTLSLIRTRSVVTTCRSWSRCLKSRKRKPSQNRNETPPPPPRQPPLRRRRQPRLCRRPCLSLLLLLLPRVMITALVRFRRSSIININRTEAAAPGSAAAAAQATTRTASLRQGRRRRNRQRGFW